jgi:asparagine synthase (glutamine-hydrolysing)
VTRDLREVIDDTLLGGELVSTGFLHQPAVAALVQDDRSGREDRSKQLWQLLTLEFWYRKARKAGVGL